MALLYNCNVATLTVVSVINRRKNREYDLHTGGSLSAIVYARMFCALQREIRSNQLHNVITHRHEISIMLHLSLPLLVAARY